MKEIDLSKYGVLFFSIGTIAFGIQNFIYDDFVMGRAPVWPASLPGQLIWAYLSGTALVILGSSLALKRRPRLAAIFIAILVFAWALFRHVLAGNFQWGTELTWFGKALTLCGGAIAVAGLQPQATNSLVNGRLSIINSTREFIIVGRITLGIFMIICGIEHFMFVEFVKSLVPSWIPGNVFWTYLTGIALIAGGAGLMVPRTARLAGILSGLMIFVWFIILHVPRAVMSLGDGNEWIAVFEALSVSGIAFVVSKK